MASGGSSRREGDRSPLGSSAVPLPKPSLIAPNPAVSAPRGAGHNPAETPENRAVQRISHSTLQAGGHRFDPGWLHWGNARVEERLYLRHLVNAGEARDRRDRARRGPA
jgi:hypothetical protein